MKAAAHLSNYVGYISTREGVDRIDLGQATKPATKKQVQMVEQLLRDFPASRELFEYEDYQAAPTRGNASEFITRALEDNYEQIAKRENYVDYIANRPRVQKLGAHGLFSGGQNSLVLSRVADEVAHHPGVVWLPIISLRREDADRLGYNNADRWRKLLFAHAMKMAEAMKIPYEQFRWYAAFHDEGHHPHVHMVCYSADGKSGFLSKQGIAEVKSMLAKEIFHQDLVAIYQRQTQRRDELTQKAGEVMEQLIAEMQTGTLNDPRIEQLMTELAQRLRGRSGKKQYGYLSPALKSMVDQIVTELEKDPRIAAAYDLWYQEREEVLRTYKNDLPQRLPLVQQKEFKHIKNIIVREAVRLGELAPPDIASQTAPADEPDDAAPSHAQGATERQPMHDEAVRLDESPPPDTASQPTPTDKPDDDAPSHVQWTRRCRKARQLMYGDESSPPDVDAAFELFWKEANTGNALAMADLGRIYADGLGRDADPEQAQEWYAKALAAFLEVEKITLDPYIQYRIGKLYAAGLGTEQDYEEAAQWLEKSADTGYKHAQYTLAGLYRDGKGVEQDYAAALEFYTKASTIPYAAYELGKLYRDGLGCDADPDRAEWYFRQAFTGFQVMAQRAQDDKLQYRIGWMLLHGVGTEQDEAAALPWLGKAADSGNIFAKYALGTLLLCGETIPRNVDRALELLTECAEEGNQYAQYTLGKAYLLGQEIPQDQAEAVHWLKLSAEQGNQHAQYFLDRFYGSIFSSATSLLYHMGNIFQEQRQPPPGGMQMTVDSKLRQKIREKKIAMGHKPDDHEDQEQQM